jgi:prepilin-type N-terminal cleavage/methylation domain-containing protein
MMHTARTRGRATRRAFTLVEAVASMVIISVIAALAAPLLIRGAEAYQGVAVRSQLQGELCSAIDRLDRSIRETSLNATEDGPDITSATPASLAWTTPGGPATLGLSGGDLRFAAPGEPETTIMSGITGLTVRCFDESNAELAGSLSGSAVLAVRRIEVTVSASRQGMSETLRLRVFLRCMMGGVGT